MNWREISAYVVIGILLAIMGYLGYNNITKNKRIINQEIIIEGLRHPRITQIIKVDSIIWKDSIKYKPYPVKTEIHDTVWIPKVFNWYGDTFKLGDSISLDWSASTTGTLDSIGFSNIFLKRKTITNIQWEDTCIAKLPEYYPKNHIGVDIDLMANNIKMFPNFDAMFWWSIKDRVKINLGGEYNMYHGEAYAKIGIGIFIK